MTTLETDTLFDTIYMGLVPKMVDEDPRVFLSTEYFWNYAQEQVRGFFEKLPVGFTGGITEQNFEDSRSAIFRCEDSPYNITIGFKPDYTIMVGNSGLIKCPSFDLLFSPIDEEGTRRILNTGLDQFFLRQGDIDDGTLIAVGAKDQEVVERDIELLRRYLPNGTEIQARNDTLFGNGKSSYKV